MPHLGVIPRDARLAALAERLRAAGTDFVLPPQQRFAGQPGEQWTMFFCDPFGNPIEVKGLTRWTASTPAEPAVTSYTFTSATSCCC
jgi:extradiol dioxygenase family protein